MIWSGRDPFRSALTWAAWKRGGGAALTPDIRYETDLQPVWVNWFFDSAPGAIYNESVALSIVGAAAFAHVANRNADTPLSATMGQSSSGRALFSASTASPVAAAFASSSAAALAPAVSLLSALGFSPAARQSVLSALALPTAVGALTSGAIASRTFNDSMTLSTAALLTSAAKRTSNISISFEATGALSIDARAQVAAVVNQAVSAGLVSGLAAQAITGAIGLTAAMLATAAARTSSTVVVPLPVAATLEAQSRAIMLVSEVLNAAVSQGVSGVLSIARGISISTSTAVNASGGLRVNGTIGLPAGLGAAAAQQVVLPSYLSFVATFDSTVSGRITAKMATAIATQLALQVSTESIIPVRDSISLDGLVVRSIDLNGTRIGPLDLNGIRIATVDLHGVRTATVDLDGIRIGTIDLAGTVHLSITN